MVFRLMISYARSGGTVLNRCLASLPSVVMLSEVNPDRADDGSAACKTVKDQARAWYGIDLRSNGYLDNVIELTRLCEGDGRVLVIRDWPVINFVPTEENHRTPAGRLTALELLRRHGEVRAFGLVRDAIDIWISNGRRRNFFGGYRRYVDALTAAGIPLFQYESLAADPAPILRRICETLGVTYTDDWRAFAGWTRVTGDVRTPGHTSRGLKHRTIRVLPRRRIPAAEIRWVNGCEDMVAANRATGYEPFYEARPRESWPRGVAARVVDWWRRNP